MKIKKKEEIVVPIYDVSGTICNGMFFQRGRIVKNVSLKKIKNFLKKTQ